MPRITSYTAVSKTQGKTGLADDDVFVIDGTNAVRKITAKELSNALVDKFRKNSAEISFSKDCFYRGANLGSGATFLEASTVPQRAAIANGTFDGLFIGDYWTVNNRLYRIADFDYWLGTGDTECTRHHVVLVSDTSFGTGKINSTNTTEGAYVGSEMYTDSSSVLNVARNTIATDFGGYLLNHREFLPNVVTNIAQSAGAWFDSTVELMNEPMVYGSFIRGRAYSNQYLETIDSKQLALFRLNPAMINLKFHYWLRDVSSMQQFANISNQGLAGSSSSSLHVRPAFAIKGTA